jgi:hypothetical protein
MDRKTIAGVVVVIVSVLFITEQFYFGGFNSPSGPTGSGRNESGTAVFNGTIRTYDPIIVIPLNTSYDILSQIKSRPDVRDLRNDSQTYIIDTETRDDVYPISQFLRSVNVTGYSVANVAASDVIQVKTPLGIENATVPNGVVRVVTEPLVDSDTQVAVSMVATVSDGLVIDIQSTSLLLQSMDLQVGARVAALDHKTYSYVIPWENRTQLGDLSSYGQYNFKKVDTIVFTTPLNVSQVMVKKQFPYVTYIDTGSAQVEPSFSNATLVALNFADTQYALPDSTLTIMTNETPDLPFDPAVDYTYELVLSNDTNYTFPVSSFLVDSNLELPLNSTITMNMSVVALGDKVLAIKSVSPPS